MELPAADDRDPHGGGRGRGSREGLAQDIFADRFLVRGRCCRRCSPHGAPPVLLIDELDRTDEPFEAYLLEVLSDWQITMPEIGTIRAAEPPIVIITSNRTREIHDAVKRRCFYHWVDYPDARAGARDPQAQGAQGVRERSRARWWPSCSACAAWTCSSCPASPRPSTGRNCLVALDTLALDPETVNNTLGVLLKYQDDIERIAGDEAARLVNEAQSAARDRPRCCRRSSRAPPRGKLAENVMHFARVLRAAGLPVGPAPVIDALRALEIAGIDRRDDFVLDARRRCFVARREQREMFDQAFRPLLARPRSCSRR